MRVVLFVLVVLAENAYSQGFQVSGGLDARYARPEDGERYKPRLEGAFLNIRKVWADALGDRWIGVAQADFDDNLRRIRPYQVYVQYKGPLGKWNVRAGHFLLPFGLLATYDTERLILQGLEGMSLGIRKDTGAGVIGRFGAWDYALTVTTGLGDTHVVDKRANPVLTGRIAYVRQDLQLGISVLRGDLLLGHDGGALSGNRVRERRISVDVTKSVRALNLRLEGIAGTDDGRTVGGGILLADYALTPNLEVNARAASWSGHGNVRSADLGLTYQARPGLYFRAAKTYQSEGTFNNGYAVQIYYEFTKQLP